MHAPCTSSCTGKPIASLPFSRCDTAALLCHSGNTYGTYHPHHHLPGPRPSLAPPAAVSCAMAHLGEGETSAAVVMQQCKGEKG